MLTYTCTTEFYCANIAKTILVGAVVKRYEGQTRLDLRLTPGSSLLTYTEVQQVQWIDDASVQSTFFSYDGQTDEGSDTVFQGDIAVNGDFPASGDRTTGDMYHVTGNVTDPVTGASFSSGSVIVWDGTAYFSMGSGGGGGSDAVMETFTLDATNISNKYVTTTNAISDATQVLLFVMDAPSQQYNVDYDVDAGNKRVGWDGLALDGVLQIGDKLTVVIL